ncbi:MAG: DNA adenine methylase [Opitutae bacterium]|nr:DNA adenine methylase [Opitutae bacterium]MCD8299390.1 DNA adenine methylase [Opitutae bacterium]
MNYIGGKFKLLPQIMPLFPERTGTFVDLFCGGCNVGINARAAKVIFNDNLSFLVDLYNEFKSKTADFVLNYIEQRIREYDLSATNEIGYKKLRKSYNENRNPKFRPMR